MRGLMMVLVAAGISMGFTVEQGALEKHLQVIVTDKVGSELKDPNSARYRLPALPEKITGDSVPVYCGCVNARNSYGGYNGQQPFQGAFLKHGREIEFILTPLDTSPVVIRNMCFKYQRDVPC